MKSRRGRRRAESAADAVFLLTGFHPDTKLLRRAGVQVDEHTLAPTYDPETLETNVPGLYLAGAVAAGKDTNKLFIENSRLHGQVIVSDILRKLRS